MELNQLIKVEIYKILLKRKVRIFLCIQEIKTVEVPAIEGYTLYSYPCSKDQMYMVQLFIQKLNPFLLIKELVMKSLTLRDG